MRNVGREEERKLVAAEPGDKVAAAKDRPKLGRDLLQQSVARLVAKSIVDFLELVEIDEKKAGRQASFVAVDHRLEPVVKGAPVGQAGEQVMVGRMVAVLLRQFDLPFLRGKFFVGRLQFVQQFGVEVFDALAVADIDDEALKKYQLAGFLEDAATDFANPDGSPSEIQCDSRHSSYGAPERLIDRRINDIQIVRMGDGGKFPHLVVNKVARRIAADRQNAVADVKHRVGQIVAATYKNPSMRPVMLSSASRRSSACTPWPTATAADVS